MRIDRDLKLVLTLDAETGPAFVYIPPLSERVFDAYALTLTQAYTAMTEMGGEWLVRMGPRHAGRVLRKVAEAEGAWESRAADPAKGLAAYTGMDMGFVAETRRTAMVATAGDGGWTTVPLQTAIDQKRLSEEDLNEIEQALCFFTVAYGALGRKTAEPMLTQVFGLYGAEFTSLSATDWAASLPTSTPAAVSGEKATASSIPR